jgi:hypothetical protein
MIDMDGWMGKGEWRGECDESENFYEVRAGAGSTEI